MADVEIVSPERARELLDGGYLYVDVRSEEEFEQGHVPGAVNVPIAPSQEFVSTMQACFDRSEKLLLGCRTGTRSRQAVTLLRAVGFSALAEMRAGIDGSRDAFGRLTPGWKSKGLPLETGAPKGRRHADVKIRTLPPR